MHKLTFVGLLALLGSLVMSACGEDVPSPTPTHSNEAVQTLAVSTFAAGLTETALANPTNTYTPLPTNTSFPLSTLPPGTTIPFGTAGAGGTPAAGCNSLVYLRDVTVPDNTAMNPGQSFTKTWLVQNLGSCNWAAGFKFSLVGGDAMGGATLTLTKPVLSGAQTELSIPMTAPLTTGTYTGMWRMGDPTGSFFGDMLTVVIHVGNPGSTPTTPAVTATVTPSPTP